MKPIVLALALCATTATQAQFIDERSHKAPAATVSAPSASPASVPNAAAPAATAVAAVAAPAAAGPRFEVTAKDRSVREALTRWARSAGWVHEPIHWTLDKDHPIEAVAGPEVFGEDFKTAVRRLLASTELTDRPVQPCFYVNHVVRVIPKSAFCDRTVE